MKMILKLLWLLVPRFNLRTMTQATFPDSQGLNLVFEKDTTAFRTAIGATGTATNLYVAAFLGGYIWIGAGTANGHIPALTAKDLAIDQTATSGATYFLRPAAAASTVWG
jgi:hypothetical protein